MELYPLSPGDYRIELRTNSFYSNPWTGGHEVVVQTGNDYLTGVLHPGREIDPFLSRYCTTIASDLGVVHLENSGRHTPYPVCLKINAQDTGGLKFVSLWLVRSNPLPTSGSLPVQSIASFDKKKEAVASFLQSITVCP